MIEAIKIISFIWILFLLLQLLSKLTSYNYIERLSKFTRSLFENHWVLLREYAKKTEKETQILPNHKTVMKTHVVNRTKYQLRNNINRHFNFWSTWNWMRHLSDGKKLQIEKNKNWKVKFFETISIKTFKDIRYKHFFLPLYLCLPSVTTLY